MKLPRVTGDKAAKALQRAGFSLVHVSGGAITISTTRGMTVS